MKTPQSTIPRDFHCNEFDNKQNIIFIQDSLQPWFIEEIDGSQIAVFGDPNIINTALIKNNDTEFDYNRS